MHFLHHLEYLQHHWADTRHLLTYNNKCPSLVSAADSCISTAPSLICTQRFESSGSQFIQHYTTQTKQAPCVVSINPPSDYLPIHPPPSTPPPAAIVFGVDNPWMLRNDRLQTLGLQVPWYLQDHQGQCKGHTALLPRT